MDDKYKLKKFSGRLSYSTFSGYGTQVGYTSKNAPPENVAIGMIMEIAGMLALSGHGDRALQATAEAIGRAIESKI